MSSTNYDDLFRELRNLAPEIPLKWGKKQNNDYDKKIKMFECNTFDQLKKQIAHLQEEEQIYFKRRWYLWQCSKCDEYLFSINPNVKRNPNIQDQGWDIQINLCHLFDIKGTVVPQSMRGDVDSLIKNPYPLVEFYYENQSRGVRYSYQNRLFIVHHSYVQQEREFFLRCAWHTKETAYKEFVSNFSKINIMQYKECKSAVIFILEQERGKVKYILNYK